MKYSLVATILTELCVRGRSNVPIVSQRWNGVLDIVSQTTVDSHLINASWKIQICRICSIGTGLVLKVNLTPMNICISRFNMKIYGSSSLSCSCYQYSLRIRPIYKTRAQILEDNNSEQKKEGSDLRLNSSIKLNWSRKVDYRKKQHMKSRQTSCVLATAAINVQRLHVALLQTSLLSSNLCAS